MSISTLFRSRTRNEPVSVTQDQKMPTGLSAKNAEMGQSAGRLQRKYKASASYLDTGRLNDHVLKDIGLERTDLTKPG